MVARLQRTTVMLLFAVSLLWFVTRVWEGEWLSAIVGVVVGGVRPTDVAPAHAAGLAGVAVVTGILAGRDVADAAREYRRRSA